MSFRRRLKNKRIPEGWELIEEVIEDFEQQMKEAVNEEHEGKRKAECTWKIHRIHWEKNRFIYDLMYVRKVMSRELVSLSWRCAQSLLRLRKAGRWLGVCLRTLISRCSLAHPEQGKALFYSAWLFLLETFGLWGVPFDHALLIDLQVVIVVITLIACSPGRSTTGWCARRLRTAP